MGKSQRKHKIFGIAGGRRESEKKDKRLCNRSLRSKVRRQLKHGDPDAPFPLPDEVFNIWSMSKEGKRYWPDAEDKDMRK